MSLNIFEIPLRRLDGRESSLAEFRGQVLLLVNVASKCGLTPQYAALEGLFQRFVGQGLQVLGFPCNDFGRQEPGSAEEIAHFCSMEYGVSFPLFEKLSINTPPRHPLYAHLIAAQPRAQVPAGSDFAEKLAQYGCSPKAPEDVLWNFEKFLVGRDGQVIGRYAPDFTPDDPVFLAALTSALAAKA